MATGQPVMAVGGFSGTNPVLNLSEFQKMAEDGEIRYFLYDQSAKGGTNSDIYKWVAADGTAVNPDIYEGKTRSANKAFTLYKLD